MEYFPYAIKSKPRFRIISYMSNDTTGIISLTSQYISANSQNMTISLGKLSFATRMLVMLRQS